MPRNEKRGFLMVSSPIFCPVCGAANAFSATTCFACGHTLQAPAPAQTQATLLKHRYALLNRLGQGGMGSVYKAEDTELGNRLVAIKEMSQKGLNQQEAVEATDAFKREALLLAGLMHPNLPRIYDHFSEQGRWYLIMDFIEGQSLEDYLVQHGGALPLEEVLEYGIQLCNVLHYLHTRQPPIIFRDLKPDNVLRTDDGHLYLIDFGIARHFKPGQARDTIAFGSPGYAAPEQYGKAQTTPSADIYSLGVLLHQMITGEDPTLKPFFFAPLYMRGPARLQSLLNSMLDMDASKRPTNVMQVKQTLQAIAQQDLSWYNNASRTPAQVVPPSLPISPPPAPPPQMLQVVPTPPVQRSPIGEVVTTYTQHSDWVSAVAWSPDGNYIASASYDKTVQVWEPSTGKLKNLYANSLSFWSNGRMHALSWSPDSTRVASGSDDKVVQIWKIGTKEPVATYHRHRERVLAVAWSPDGKYIASASSTTMDVWDASNTGKTLATFSNSTRPIQALAWSPDSTLLAVGGWNTIFPIYECFAAKLDPANVVTYQEPSDFIRSLAWSPNGLRVASASNDKTVKLWDPQTGQILFTYKGHTDAVKVVAWSPDGKYLASGGVDTTVQVWDPQTGKTVFTYKGHFGTVYGLAWSKASKYIASGDAHNLVQVWRAV
jgi:serine/threonine protein kinase